MQQAEPAHVKRLRRCDPYNKLRQPDFDPPIGAHPESVDVLLPESLKEVKGLLSNWINGGEAKAPRHFGEVSVVCQTGKRPHPELPGNWE